MEQAKRYLALGISYIFSPPAWIFYFLCVAYQQGIFFNKLNPLESAILLAIIILPLLFLFYQRLTKKITDLDISVRVQRYAILIVLNVCIVLVTAFLKISGHDNFFRLSFIFLVIHAITSIITLRYKISFHMTYTVTFSILINLLYGYSLPLLFVTIPAIFWARIYLKQHTWKQLILAMIVDFTILGIMLR
jgi:hypothetical protein